MKHFLFGLAVAATLPVLPAQAQTEKGSRYYGLGINNLAYQGRRGTTRNLVSGTITPTAGWFVADKLLVGAGLRLSYFRTVYDNYDRNFNPLIYVNRNMDVEVAPFVRYYLLGQQRHRLFAQVGAGHLWARQGIKHRRPDEEEWTKDQDIPARQFSYHAVLGYNYFLTPGVALEVLGGFRRQHTYRLNTTASLSPFNLVNLQAGFAVFLPASQKAAE